jgi:hypothetical protein
MLQRNTTEERALGSSMLSLRGQRSSQRLAVSSQLRICWLPPPSQRSLRGAVCLVQRMRLASTERHFCLAPRCCLRGDPQRDSNRHRGFRQADEDFAAHRCGYQTVSRVPLSEIAGRRCTGTSRKWRNGWFRKQEGKQEGRQD